MPLHPSELELDALFRTHGPMVRRALVRLGVTEANLDDAVQDVFVVLVRRLESFERGRSLDNWLWGIARGVASTHRRTQRRRQRLQAALPTPIAPGSHPVENAIGTAEAKRILQRFLCGLDDDKCAVFVMSEVEGRTGPEIAQRLDVNLNTVYARLRAAKKRWADAVQGRPPSWLQAAMATVSPATAASTPAWFQAAAGSALAAALVIPAATSPEVELPDLRTRPATSVASVDALASRASSRATSFAERSRQPALPAKEGDELAMTAAQENETMRLPAAAALAVAVTAAPAEAKPRKDVPAVSPANDQDADAAARVDTDGVDREYTFLDDKIDGDRLSPDGTILLQRPSLRFPSLISVRGHFVPELITFAADV